jgi:hypothetical protein
LLPKQSGREVCSKARLSLPGGIVRGEKIDLVRLVWIGSNDKTRSRRDRLLVWGTNIRVSELAAGQAGPLSIQ